MRLNTFGRVHILSDGGEELALQPRPLAVLVYLVVGGARDRDHLADLFWPGSKNGLNNLSTTLNRIRAALPGAVWVKGNTLVGVDMASDVGDLRDAIDRSDFSSVAELYDAAFLGSLKLRGKTLEFEEWVLEERTSLAATAELVLLQQGRDLFDNGEFRSAATAVEAAWGISIRDGFPSPDYFDLYHRVLATAARPAASAVRSMADELGIEVTPVEPVAIEPSQVGDASTVTSPNRLGDDLLDARNATPLFGCQQELAAIAASVAAHRLTTIVGLGGSGKTRLAAEFFHSSNVEGDYPHRYWVDLRGVVDPEHVGSAIVTALGQRFDSVSSLADWLPDDEPVLLVVDNFEHVLQSAGVVAELTDRNAAIRVLITSRVPLQVDAESLIQLSGLDTGEHEQDSPAEQLFVSSARRAGVSSDRLGGASRAAIQNICHRVGGNPLALEIAGSWAQVLPPAEILDVLSVDNELLGSPMAGDLRSMESVLQQSWLTLAETEQKTLMLLAAFPGGCLTNEALKLKELPIQSIRRLVQHSLARLQIDGRITLHPLIAGHAIAELEQRPELLQEFRQVLSDWCQSYSTVVLAGTDDTHSQALASEVANFTAAWLWDAQQGRWQLHRSTLAALRQFFTESGRAREGRALLAAVADELRADPNRPTDLLAEVLEALGWFEVLSGDVTQAKTRLDEALALGNGENAQARAQLLRTVGALQLVTGEIDEATASFNAGLALVADDTGALAASLQYDLAQAHHYRGARDEARAAARLALRAGRASNNWIVMGRSYLLLADIEVASDPNRAVVLLNEGWTIAKEASLDHLAIYFPAVLGSAHLKLDKPELAEEYFTEAMQAANSVGQLSTLCANHVGRAEARLQQGRSAGAIEDLETGIRLALKTGSGRYLMWAAVVSCSATSQQAPPAQTKELLSLVLRHPSADQDARDKAQQVWRDIFDDGPPPAGEPTPTNDPDGLDEAAERSLELLRLG